MSLRAAVRATSLGQRENDSVAAGCISSMLDVPVAGGAEPGLVVSTPPFTGGW